MSAVVKDMLGPSRVELVSYAIGFLLLVLACAFARGQKRVNGNKGQSKEDPLLDWTKPTREDCPICMIPLPSDGAESMYWICCGKSICCGCFHDQVQANKKDGISRVRICPFCRTDAPATDDVLDSVMKRAKAGHHDAIYKVGGYYFHGKLGLHQDKAEGVKWWCRAAEAGDPVAAHALGQCYQNGDGVEQDFDRALEYYQKAADLGHIHAYVGVGNVHMKKVLMREAFFNNSWCSFWASYESYEKGNGVENMDLAMAFEYIDKVAEGGYVHAFAAIGGLLIQKGWIEGAMLNYRKAALCGYSSKALFDFLRWGYKEGYITKEEFAFTLRENQKASAEMKSVSREKVKKTKSK